MKLLIISPSFPPDNTGEAEYSSQLAERMQARGHSVTVLTNPRDGNGAASGVPTKDMPDWNWRVAPRLIRQISELNPDGVVLIYTSWLYKEHPMITFLPTYLGWIKPAMKLVTIFQTEDGAKTLKPVSRIIRKLAELASRGRQTHIAFGSLLDPEHTAGMLGPAILASIQQQAPAIPIRAILIPPPSLLHSAGDANQPKDCIAMKAKLGIPADAMVLSYFGYVYPGKGVETLFAAVKELLQRGRRVALIMVGGGRGDPTANGTADQGSFEQSMQELAQSLGISAFVHWQGGYQQGAKEPGQDLAMADMAILPFDDGAELRRSSLAVVASAGLPIITTTPMAGEVAFVHEKNVLLCPPQSATLVADAACRIMDDPQLREKLRLGALDLANEWFSWHLSIQQIEASL